MTRVIHRFVEVEAKAMKPTKRKKPLVVESAADKWRKLSPRDRKRVMGFFRDEAKQSDDRAAGSEDAKALRLAVQVLLATAKGKVD